MQSQIKLTIIVERKNICPITRTHLGMVEAQQRNPLQLLVAHSLISFRMATTPMQADVSQHRKLPQHLRSTNLMNGAFLILLRQYCLARQA